MIPTNPSDLPDEFRDFYERIKTEDDIVLAENEVRLAEVLAHDGLGIGGDLRPGKRFWPLNLHSSAAFVLGGRGWVNELYAEVSFCAATGCKCNDITWHNCGERLATFYGAVLRLEKEDPTRGSLTVYDDGNVRQALRSRGRPSARSSRTTWSWKPLVASAPDS